MDSNVQVRVGIIGFFATIILFGFLFAYEKYLHNDFPKMFHHRNHVVVSAGISQSEQLKIMGDMDSEVRAFDTDISTVGDNSTFALNPSTTSSQIYQQAKNMYLKNKEEFSAQGVSMHLTSFKITKQTFNDTTMTNQIECKDTVGAFIGKQEVAEVDNSFQVDVVYKHEKNVITMYENDSSQVKNLT